MNEQTKDRLLLAMASVLYNLDKDPDYEDKKDHDELFDAIQEGVADYEKTYDEKLQNHLW